MTEPRSAPWRAMFDGLEAIYAATEFHPDAIIWATAPAPDGAALFGRRTLVEIEERARTSRYWAQRLRFLGRKRKGAK